MPTEKYGEMPPRPPLSVPFPLRLGDDFHLGSAETVEEAARWSGPEAPADGGESSPPGGAEPAG